MDQFQARSRRYDVELPIRFFSSDGLATGVCVNVSDSGMLVMFDKPVTIWAVGKVSVLLDDRYVTVGVRVARVAGREAGLAFEVEENDDAEAIDQLMEFAATHKQAH